MNERVLLTGITGYIGQHCGAELLRQGYEVVGTVRAPAKADATRSAIAAVARVDKLSFAEADLLSDRGWTRPSAGAPTSYTSLRRLCWPSRKTRTNWSPPPSRARSEWSPPHSAPA